MTRRVPVEVIHTRIGAIPIIRAPKTASGIRTPSDTERAAMDALERINERLVTDAHPHGDHVADIVVRDDKTWHIDWCRDAIRNDQDIMHET